MASYQAITEVIDRECMLMQEKIRLRDTLRELGDLEGAVEQAKTQRDAMLLTVNEAELKLATIHRSIADMEQVMGEKSVQLQAEYEAKKAAQDADYEQRAQHHIEALRHHAEDAEKALAEQLEPLQQQVAALHSAIEALNKEEAIALMDRDAAVAAKADAEAGLAAVHAQIQALAAPKG